MEQRFPKPADWNEGRIDWAEELETLPFEHVEKIIPKIQEDKDMSIYYRFSEVEVRKDNPNEQNPNKFLKTMFVILEESASEAGIRAKQKLETLLNEFGR